MFPQLTAAPDAIHPKPARVSHTSKSILHEACCPLNNVTCYPVTCSTSHDTATMKNLPLSFNPSTRSLLGIVLLFFSSYPSYHPQNQVSESLRGYQPYTFQPAQYSDSVVVIHVPNNLHWSRSMAPWNTSALSRWLLVVQSQHQCAQ